jgi:hypothetical protein
MDLGRADAYVGVLAIVEDLTILRFSGAIHTKR